MSQPRLVLGRNQIITCLISKNDQRRIPVHCQWRSVLRCSFDERMERRDASRLPHIVNLHVDATRAAVGAHNFFFSPITVNPIPVVQKLVQHFRLKFVVPKFGV